ncbi:MAG: hypothetical protein U1F37_09885 [Alphaproteobacteria bacterium]
MAALTAHGRRDEFDAGPGLAALGIGFRPVVPYVSADGMERRHS